MEEEFFGCGGFFVKGIVGGGVVLGYGYNFFEERFCGREDVCVVEVVFVDVVYGF